MNLTFSPQHFLVLAGLRRDDIQIIRIVLQDEMRNKFVLFCNFCFSGIWFIDII